MLINKFCGYPDRMELIEKRLNTFVEKGRCGVVATLASLVSVLFGLWANKNHIQLFHEFGFRSHPMHPLLGFALFFSSFSLLIRYCQNRLRKVIGEFLVDFLLKLPLISFIVGAWTLIQLISGKILWFESGFWKIQTYDPVRFFMPSPEASICLILSSFSVLALDLKSEKIRKISETLTLIFFGLTLLSLVQLISGFDTALTSYLPIQAIGMALMTAFAFLFLSIGLFCYQPRIGYLSLFFKNSLGADLARKLVLKVLFVPILIEFIIGILVGLGFIQPIFRQILANTLIFCFFIFSAWESARHVDKVDSERRELENELKESEEKYRTLIELAPESIFVADLDGQYIAVNDSAAQLVKTSKEKIIGKTIIDLIPSEDVPRLNETKAYLSEHPSHKTDEWRLKQGDGNFVDVEVSAKILSHNRWIAFVRSIEERKKAEATIKEAEARYRVLVESITEGILLVDRSGTIRLVNKKAMEFYGYTEEELLTIKIEKLIPDIFQNYHPQDNLEYTSIRKDGSKFLSEVTMNYIPNLNNEQMISLVIRDISDEKINEEHMRFSSIIGYELTLELDMKKRLRKAAMLITQSKADWCSVFIINGGGKLEAFYAYANDSENNFKLQSWYSDDHRIEPNQILQKIIDEKKPKLFNWNKLEKMKGQVLCNSLAEILDSHSVAHFPLSARGRAFGIITLVKINSDFTAKEFSLARASAERIALSVDNAYLYQQAQKASATREELIAIVSHDLRTPLTTINLGIQKLSRLTNKPIDKDEFIEQIKSTTHKMNASVKRSSELISDLLTFAKIESGTFTVEKNNEYASLLINETIENHSLLSQEKGIQLISAVNPDLKVQADHSKLIQVLSNLTGNALKFTPTGGSVKLSAETCQNGFALFKIEDSGVGIEEEQLNKIFDRYWQPEQSHSQGAGLGLSIVKGIVEAHGGRIWVESEVGVGTTFLFTIPESVSLVTDLPHLQN